MRIEPGYSPCGCSTEHLEINLDGEAVDRNHVFVIDLDQGLLGLLKTNDEGEHYIAGEDTAREHRVGKLLVTCGRCRRSWEGEPFVPCSACNGSGRAT